MGNFTFKYDPQAPPSRRVALELDGHRIEMSPSDAYGLPSLLRHNKGFVTVMGGGGVAHGAHGTGLVIDPKQASWLADNIIAGVGREVKKARR